MQRTVNRNRVTLENFEETITEQQHKKQTDMNYILKDYARTGLIKHSHQNKGNYDDVSQIDFQTAQNIVADSKSMFESLPAMTRKEFDNDVGQFLQFCRDPENGVKMQEMGITAGIDGLDSQGELIQGMKALVDALKPVDQSATPVDAQTGEIKDKTD